MKLSTIAADDWHEFSWKNVVKFHCACVLAGHGNSACLDCMGQRIVYPTQATAYDSGYEVTGTIDRIPYTGVVAFEYQGHVWMGTRLREGVDPAPFLASAWLKMFPKSKWLPEQFVDVNSVPDYYNSLPKIDADAIVAKRREALAMTAEKSRADLERLDRLSPGT